MVFSSIPAYLDPTNWQQQQNHQIIGSNSPNPLLLQPQHSAPPPQPPLQPHGGGVGGGTIRPNSMAERARMANIPMPETALKCPRCDSTNTKFCYFNNYSLTQPRHFCKTCRRYWTRNGALRNVPVGGGCRRNKRSKSTSSKSSASQGDRQMTNSISTSSLSNNVGTTNIQGLTQPHLPPVRFMSPLSQLTDNFTNDMGLNYSGASSSLVGTSEMNFHGTSNLLGGNGGMTSLLSSVGGGGIEPWRLQQFPFLGGGLDTSSTSGIFQFHGGESGFMGGGGEVSQNQVRPKFSSSMMSQLSSSIKMEDTPELNLASQLMGGGATPANDHEWNTSAANNWTDLSNFNSSNTTRNPL